MTIVEGSPNPARPSGRQHGSSTPRNGWRGRTVELRQLQYFLAVADDLHFGRGASRLFISQPALSQAIARLERALEVQLFVRTRHGVQLTDAGAALMPRARQLLADCDEAVAHARRAGRGEGGLLRLGVALLADHLMAPALEALAVECPGMAVDQAIAMSESLLALLREGNVDVALVHRVPALAALEGVQSEVVRTCRLAILVSSANPLAGREIVKLRDLHDQTFFQQTRSLEPSGWEGFAQMCQSFGGFTPKVLEATFTIPYGPALKPVADDKAVTVVPEGTAQAAPVPGITEVPIESPPMAQIAMAWRNGSIPPALQRFLAFVRAYRDRHNWA